MATRKSRKPARTGGSTWFGFFMGIVFGLAAAVAVALFVTKAPIPFVDKALNPQKAALPSAREAPDPNVGLAQRGTATPPPAEEEKNNTMAEDIDRLIASLSQAEPAAQPRTNVAPPNPAPSTATPSAANQTAYYLQAGAFISIDEAQALRARVLMLGLNGFVQTAQVDGTTLHRVRVGPFHGIDEMNRTRITLGKENIASTVVRP